MKWGVGLAVGNKQSIAAIAKPDSAPMILERESVLHHAPDGTVQLGGTATGSAGLRGFLDRVGTDDTDNFSEHMTRGEELVATAMYCLVKEVRTLTDQSPNICWLNRQWQSERRPIIVAAVAAVFLTLSGCAAALVIGHTSTVPAPRILDAQSPVSPGTTPDTAPSPSGGASQSATSLPSQVPALGVRPTTPWSPEPESLSPDPLPTSEIPRVGVEKSPTGTATVQQGSPITVQIPPLRIENLPSAVGPLDPVTPDNPTATDPTNTQSTPTQPSNPTDTTDPAAPNPDMPVMPVAPRPGMPSQPE